MGRPALKIDVTKEDHQELRKLVKSGVQQVRVVLRALALLQLSEHASAPHIARAVQLTPQAIRRLGHRYQEAGLDAFLYEKQRLGAAEVLERARHRHGVRRSGRRSGALDCATGRRGGGQAEIGPPRGERNNPDSAAAPRPQALAGENVVSPT
jgi:Helix-turn-helix domain